MTRGMGQPAGLGAPDQLSAHGMPWRTLLLEAFAVGQGQSTATRLGTAVVPCCFLLHAPDIRKAPLGYEAPAGCPVGCSLVVLVPLYLGERLPVVSVCTGLSRLFTAGLGDKCSDKPRSRRQLARGVWPVLGDNGPVAKPPEAARQPRSASLSGFSPQARFPRIAPVTWANDVPLETAAYR